jgi:hypothetical protein
MPSEIILQARGVSKSPHTCYLVSQIINSPNHAHIAPAWIADTGIGEQRDAVKSKEADQTLRQKTRERVQPKMGKIDIDYQKLHDAFFRFQGKPSMSKFGEA